MILKYYSYYYIIYIKYIIYLIYIVYLYLNIIYRYLSVDTDIDK